MAIGSVVLAFVAGALSVLSPCVLPILPVVLGAAASEHKLGPVALAAGLAVSFVIAGLFVATIGYSIGLDGDALRYVAAALITAMGAVLILPSLQARLALASGPIAGWTDRHFARIPAGRVIRPVRDWRAARSRLEPVRRADAGSRLTACRSRP